MSLANRNHLAISAKTFGTIMLALVVTSLVCVRWRAIPIHCPWEEHVFLGQTYSVEVCYVGGGDLHSNMRLRIFSKDGSLVGQRGFTVLNVPGNLNYMHYRSDAIAYSDDDSDHSSLVVPKDRVLSMPPTWWDWMTANVSRLLWT